MAAPRKLAFGAAVALVAVVVLALANQLHADNLTKPLATLRPIEATPVTAVAPSATPSASNVNRPSRREDPPNIYAHTKIGHMSATAEAARELVYVPNPRAGTLEVIDPNTLTVIRRVPIGDTPQHVTPSWNLRWLYVDVSHSNALAVIDPRTGKIVRAIRDIAYPYNLYFTVDGSKAIVVTELLDRLDFRNPKTWKLIKSVPLPCDGPDHMDFSASGRYAFIGCEFDGRLVRVDTVHMKTKGFVPLGGLPVDLKLSPDGSVFYVANQGLGGVSVVDPKRMRVVKFLKTGRGAHGMAISRDTKSIYVSNRMAGSISVIDFDLGRVVETWTVGGSPDMLQVSPDGRRLWYSNRFGTTVTVLNTSNGRVVKNIEVGADPHGLAYFPQPGRFSLGHNGVYR